MHPQDSALLCVTSGSFPDLLTRVVSLILFGLTTFSFSFQLIFLRDHENSQKWITEVAKRFFLTGTFALFANVLISTIFFDNFGITQIIFFVAFLLCFLFLLLQDVLKESHVLAFLLSVMVFFTTSMSSLIEPITYHHGVLGQYYIGLHIVLSVISQSLFVISFTASVLFILKHKDLKRKQILKNEGMTSLSFLENLAVWSTVVGYGFITLALLSGFILVFVGKSDFKIDFFKFLWAFFIWGWYSFTILGRNVWGLRGRKGAWLIVVGCILLITGFLVNIYYYNIKN